LELNYLVDTPVRKTFIIKLNNKVEVCYGKKRQHYSDEFKRKAVEHVENSNKTQSEIAKGLDIPSKSLTSWKKIYGKKKRLPRCLWTLNVLKS
jgi:transposase-like protein